MRNGKKGLTVTSIVVYVILFFMFTSITTIISSRFNKNLFNDRGIAINTTALNKLQYNLLASANESYNVKGNVDGNKTILTFSNSDEYVFDLDKNTVYKNGGKLVNYVKAFDVRLLDDVINIDITVNKYTNELARNIKINVHTEDYIDNGLVVHYDGINNTGTKEHNNVAMMWKDLSNNNFDAILASAITHDGINGWVENGIQLTNSEGYDSRYAKATIDKNTYSSMTFEITLTPITQFGNTNDDYVWAFAFYTSTNVPDLRFATRDGVQLMYGSGNNTVFVGPSIKKDKRYTLTFVQNDLTTRTLYSNGKIYQTKTGLTLNEIDFNNYPYLKINSHKNSGYIIHSVRIYDREISAEEVEHNYMVDRLRFGEK